MDKLYAVGCHGQPGFTHCEPFVKAAAFGPTQAIALTVFCDLLDKYVFNPCHLRRVYGAKYASLPEDQQRRLGNLHIGILIKATAFALICSAMYLSAVRDLTWETQGWFGMTVAEMVNLAVMSYPALCIYDMIKTANMRPLYVLHHLFVIGWILGAFYLVLTTSSDQPTESLEQAIHLCKISVGMCVFSSICSVVSRLTYLVRTLSSKTNRFLPHAFFLGFAAQSLFIAAEAGLITYLVVAYREKIPSAAPPLFGLAQAVFTATKIKSAMSVLDVYKRQVQDSRRMVDGGTASPGIVGKREKGAIRL
ncbi:hypothetical protein BDV18DRAFT_129756 [Aspergillus unguis]